MLYILYIKWCVHGYGLHAIQKGSGATGCVSQVIALDQKRNRMAKFSQTISNFTHVNVFDACIASPNIVSNSELIQQSTADQGYLNLKRISEVFTMAFSYNKFNTKQVVKLHILNIFIFFFRSI